MSDNQTPKDPKESTPNSGKKSISFGMSQAPESEDIMKSEGIDSKTTISPLLAALQQANGGSSKGAPRLSFIENPSTADNYTGLFKSKARLLPDSVIKSVRTTDHLIAAILRARSSHLSLFGHLRKDRFDIGIELAIKPEFYKILNPEQLQIIKEKMKLLEQVILNCGFTEGLESQDKMTLSEWMGIQAYNGLSFGRFATEVIRDRSGDPDENGNYPFHRFRPVDVATIYKAVRKGEQVGNNLRATALRALESITGEKPNIDMSRLREDEYAWIQVVDGTPRQAFTHDEMLVHNLFPSTDIEHNGYPVSPLDTVISSVTTHISIDAYKKLYFQNGRASKGMLIIQSDEVDEQVLNSLKTQFNASINSVSNSFRTPIFGIGKDDKVDWLPTTGEGASDGDFQFMYDQIARNILATFSISPDELPGYAHLSRGTNSQTLSECFDPETLVLTKDGSIRASDILGEKREAPLEVWTGKEWQKGRIFWTGEKELRETVLSSGLKLNTSPDHRFMVINESGEPDWKQQKDIKIGDYVLTNSNPVLGSVDIVPEYNGKALTLEMMEFLGWVTGDGTIVAPRKRAGGLIKTYYHHDKEGWIQDRHMQILSDFGIDAHRVVKEIPELEQEKIKERYGIQSVSSIRRYNTVYNTEFVRWLIENGFDESKNGKTVPEAIHSMPLEYRAAFLRGLFSADGHTSSAGSVVLTVQNEEVRESVRQLLIGMGIRTTTGKGITRRSGFYADEKTFSHKITIKDTDKYWDLIGFLQPHKIENRKQKQWTLDSIPTSVMSNISKIILEKNSTAESALDKFDKDALNSSLKGKRNITKERLISLAKQVDCSLPKWFTEYNMDYVQSIIGHQEKIEMVDVEVFNDEHAFILNGILVHNSSNEFKLTAARDTGLRPLILKFQTFFNQRLLPIIDPKLARICEVRLAGIDAQSKEQESTRLQQDMATHMTYDEVLKEVDKEPIGSVLGGKFPFNERLQLLMDKYLDVSQIKSALMGDPSAAMDPMLKYKRDPFWLQQLQLISSISPATVKAFFAPRPYALDFLKMEIEDNLEEDEEIES